MLRHRVHIEPDVGEFDDFARAVLPELHRYGHVLTGDPHDGADRRYYNDMSMIDIARTLDISVGTVKSQTSKAMRKLRANLAADGPA